MAVDLAVLRVELETDPLSLGYAPDVAAGNTQVLADTMNLVRDSINIPRQLVESFEVVSSIAPADWEKLSIADKDLIDLITRPPQVDLHNANVSAQLLKVFPSDSATRTALTALMSRKASRSEQLFGVAVSSNDIAQALAS